MNVQTKIEAPSLIAALAAALPELEGAKKNAVNGGFKSKYADLGSVIEAIRPIAEHGIWFVQVTHENAGGAEVETLFIGHGEQMSAGRVFVPASKKDAHGFGSALTYARRYGLQTAFGLSTEDDDGEAAVKTAKEAPRTDEMPDHEWSKLAMLIKATSPNIPAMLKHLGIVLPDNNLKLLSQADYPRVHGALEDKLARMAKEETDEKAKENA